MEFAFNGRPSSDHYETSTTQASVQLSVIPNNINTQRSVTEQAHITTLLNEGMAGKSSVGRRRSLDLEIRVVDDVYGMSEDAVSRR